MTPSPAAPAPVPRPGLDPGSGSAPVRVLVVHGEGLFCAGAQKMLAYLLEGADPAELEVAVALAPNAKFAPLIPPNARTLPLPSNQQFSPLGLVRQTLALRRAVRAFQPAILHGWTARDWELTAAGRLVTRRPAVGLLHDHPLAPHISPSRRRLMLRCATHGLDRVLCVSGAVAEACLAAGYPRPRLHVVRNGIPHPPAPPPPHVPAGLDPNSPVRLGFLGVFSERKGLRTLFQILDALPHSTPPANAWEIHLGGGAQDERGEQLIRELTDTYSSRPWWPRVHWTGWIRQPAEFLASIHLLVVPSSEFDPFPTVLLEAGGATRAVFAARIGGVAEIVEDGTTGWLFDPTQPHDAARHLADLLAAPARLAAAGLAGARRVREAFSVDRMVRGYREVYLALGSRRR